MNVISIAWVELCKYQLKLKLVCCTRLLCNGRTFKLVSIVSAFVMYESVRLFPLWL